MDNRPGYQLSPRARFAADLAEQRRSARLTQAALAARVNCHESLVSHIETGRRAPTLDFAQGADKAFGLDGHFVDLFRRISQSPALGWFARWVEEIEPQAVILQSWDPLLIPGLLQTAEYAHAIFSAGASPELVEERVQARIRRIGIFDGPQAPTFLALIDEGVLHRPIGGVDVLAKQLSYLLEISYHPRITVQLVPTTAGCAAGMMSAFAFARLRDGSEVVSADSVLSGQVTGDHEAVVVLKQRYDTIRAHAQPKSESQQTIENAVRKWIN
ncbi:Helix-turn-helix domain-containing protein [Nonomuraea maritima]|uniref:Helix-turn-helix domain-containing protein n=1 Tax=Nonomuraea maritima TaxID=683260 RepID=A0A1G8USN6_9ACTN|nr:helix-turn-helix transcriptional regulator [Nonomuraea maritima]SDJ55970.1 Helix-turn-helix domain-containing protein [Nonomuraea maritima]